MDAADRRDAARCPRSADPSQDDAAGSLRGPRAEFSRDEADEAILLNQRGEVCEGTITNIFIDIGEPVLVTPALASGLLPGVLGGSLLDQVTARRRC